MIDLESRIAESLWHRPEPAARVEAGDEEARAGDEEARVPADQPLDEAGPAERDAVEERVEPPPAPVADRAGRERDDEDVAGDAQAGTEEPPAAVPSAGADGEGPALRAPEPGRAGGVADGERALRGAVPAPREVAPDAEPEPAPAAPPAPAPSAEDLAAAAPPAAPGREAAPPPPAPEAPPAPAPLPLEPIEQGTVFLQVGAFTRAQSASGLSSELRRKGFEPSIETGLVNGEGYYRVRVGPFQVPAERARLEEVRAALAAAGYGPVVARPGPGS